MNRVKRRAVSILCIAALIVSLFGIMPASNSYANTFYLLYADGTCESGDLSDSKADNYYFYTFGTGWARIGVSSSCSSADFKLYSDVNLTNEIATDDDGYVYLTDAEYYVQVYCSKNHTCGAYEISVNFKESSDNDKEPNDSMDTAITLVSGQQYKGTAYSSVGDYDWYKLEVKTESSIHIALNSVQTCKYNLYYNGSLRSYGENDTASGLTRPFYHMPAGTYYIQVYPSSYTSGVAAVGGNYFLTVTAVEYPTVNKITKVTPTGIGKAKITWTKSNYADGYYLYKESTTTGSWSYVATIPAGTLSYTDYNAPAPGASCIYHICGYRINDTDSYNQEMVSEETNEGYTYKGKVPTPTNVKTTKYSSSIKVSWNKVSGATGYKIYRKANGGDYSLVKTVKSGSTLSWKNTSVKKGTNYTYKVKAYYKDYSGKYYYSNSSSTAKAKMTGSISAPSNVKAKKYSSYNKVTWNKVSNVTGYKVYRKVGSGSYKLVKTTTSTSFKDKSVKSGKKYTYKVKAYYKNYTYSSSKGRYTYTTVNSKYSKIATVRR